MVGDISIEKSKRTFLSLKDLREIDPPTNPQPSDIITTLRNGDILAWQDQEWWSLPTSPAHNLQPPMNNTSFLQ